MTATFAKLKDGTWGLRVNGPKPTPGTVVQVMTKAGRCEIKTVGTVLWHGAARDGKLASLCSIEQSAVRSMRALRGRRTGCSCGSIEDSPRESDCASCQFENFDQ